MCRCIHVCSVYDAQYKYLSRDMYMKCFVICVKRLDMFGMNMMYYIY